MRLFAALKISLIAAAEISYIASQGKRMVNAATNGVVGAPR